MVAGPIDKKNKNKKATPAVFAEAASAGAKPSPDTNETTKNLIAALTAQIPSYSFKTADFADKAGFTSVDDYRNWRSNTLYVDDSDGNDDIALPNLLSGFRAAAIPAAPVATVIASEHLTGSTWDKFVTKLKQDEGVRHDVYKDSLGFLTVGVGHLVRPTDGLKFRNTISNEDIDKFLKQDASKAFIAARKQATELGRGNDGDFVAALGAVNYQLGTGWRSKFDGTWALMKQGDFTAAAERLETSKWAQQTPKRVDDFQTALLRADDNNTAVASVTAPHNKSTPIPG